MSEKRKVTKEVTTVFPTGFRVATNQGLAILEFLDDRGERMEVIFSAAMGKGIVKDLSDKLGKFLKTDSGMDEDGKN